MQKKIKNVEKNQKLQKKIKNAEKNKKCRIKKQQKCRKNKKMQKKMQKKNQKMQKKIQQNTLKVTKCIKYAGKRKCYSKSVGWKRGWEHGKAKSAPKGCKNPARCRQGQLRVIF